MSSERQSVILNVDDDDTARYVTTKVLTGAGFKVEEAASGGEALAMARRSPDLIILDMRLPDMNGYEVCRRIKADPRTSSIPVLQTSASFVTSEKRVQGLEGGADGYLTQPCESVELVATVRSLLRARQAEDTARSAAAEWQATFDGIGDGVCLLDASGQVRRRNDALARLLGLPSLAEGAVFLDAAPPAAREALTDLLLATRRESAEVQLKDRWLRVKVDPLADGGGRVIIVTDITEHKRLEEERRLRAEGLADADRRKDEFLAMLAHELRNPLNAISTAMYIQNTVGAQDERNQRLRATVTRQTRHLARLVDDLLDVSRITRGKILLQKEVLDLRIIVQRALETSRITIESRRHTIDVRLPEEPLMIEADPVRLEQVVVNLLNNAAKYTPLGGRIDLSLGHEGKDGSAAAILEVRDNGMGISSDMLDPIFDLFRQQEQSLARSGGGLGIGLTLVRSLVTMHGGTITATSEGRDKGSQFRVRFPLHMVRPAVKEGVAGAQLEGAPSRRVLLIEDNLDALEMLRDVLQLEGHHVEVASDGVMGLELALSMRPDFALADIGLPGIDGYQVAERVRAEASGKNIFLVAITGYGRSEDRDRAYQAGFDAHIVKPVDPEKILAMLREDPQALREAQKGSRRPSVAPAPASTSTPRAT